MQSVYAVSEPNSQAGVQPVYAVRNLPPGDCGAGLQPVNTVSEPNSQAGVQHVNAVSEPTSGPGVQPVYAEWEPTSRGLRGRRAASLCGVRTYLQQTGEQESSLFSGV